VKILITQQVASSVRGHSGQFTLLTERKVAAVPRPGEWIELAPGWCSKLVKDITHRADGTINVELHPVIADCLANLEECNERATDPETGWYWSGGNSPFK
jgi:hypothetical protein